jgi:lipopolysaccharide/colanic/teichoic acid biosynthesis glycosyltransferase
MWPHEKRKFPPEPKPTHFFAIAARQGRAMNRFPENRPPCGSSDGLSNAAQARNRVPSWKRALDVACVIVTSIFWAPAWLMIAMYIRMVSPGPVLFRQERVGHMGKRFRCLKFRTMAPNADTSVHHAHLHQLMTSNQPMNKLDGVGDPRLIPGGVWLRSLGVDELPQLINVLRGEMSLVGPRPCIAYEYEIFQPRHRQRCGTLPGLTGLWQVNGKNRTTFERMMELDLAYVEKKSLFLDLKIIFCTPPAILLQVWDAASCRKAAARTAPAESTGTVPPHRERLESGLVNGRPSRPASTPAV